MSDSLTHKLDEYRDECHRAAWVRNSATPADSCIAVMPRARWNTVPRELSYLLSSAGSAIFETHSQSLHLAAALFLHVFGHLGLASVLQ